MPQMPGAPGMPQMQPQQMAPQQPMQPQMGAPVQTQMPLAGQPAYDPNQMGMAVQQAMQVQQPMMPGAGGPGVDMGVIQGIDFNQVEDKIILVLDASIEYEFAVTGVEGKKNSSGDDMIELHLAVSHPQVMPNGQSCKGASMYDNLNITPKALWKVKSFFSACEMLNQSGRFSGQKLTDLIGCVVRARVVNEEYNGVTRSKISGAYMPAFETQGMSPVAPAQPGNFAPQVQPASPMPQVQQPQNVPQMAPQQMPQAIPNQMGQAPQAQTWEQQAQAVQQPMQGQEVQQPMQPQMPQMQQPVAPQQPQMPGMPQMPGTLPG